MRRLFILLALIGLLCPTVRGAQPVRYAALTFDDGPSGRFTRALLAGLEERGVHATFFLCGYRLEDQQQLAQQIRRAGHEIGLHGYSHRNMTELSPGALRQELEETLALLPPGCLVNLLRPPGGNRSDTLRAVAREMGVAIVTWSVDPRDWETEDADLVYQRLVSQTGDGDILLMHDLSDSSVEAALRAVDELQTQGVQFLTVSQLALLRLVHLDSGRVYQSFPQKTGE